ncbi:MAG: hypothetical protein UU90_C0025G0001, partial [candidate division WWE3 bacterium GW2011_GWD2_42_11]
KGKYMFKIYIDSRLRKQTTVSLLKKYFIFWIKIDSLTLEADPVDVLAETLRRNNLRTDRIEVYEAYPGPGSYTGLKMGHAVVNVLNWVYKGVPAAKLPLPKYGSEPNITLPKTKKKAENKV